MNKKHISLRNFPFIFFEFYFLLKVKAHEKKLGNKLKYMYKHTLRQRKFSNSNKEMSMCSPILRTKICLSKIPDNS